MTYEGLWVVTFVDPSDPQRIRAAGPFPTIEPAEEFARRLRDAWPADEDPEIDVTQLESADSVADVIAEE